MWKGLTALTTAASCCRAFHTAGPVPLRLMCSYLQLCAGCRLAAAGQLAEIAIGLVLHVARHTAIMLPCQMYPPGALHWCG
jgi:hypothetical protein